ncbi:MAG: TetR family transcriptional regulator C-terminal domain-containing protein, partial [Haliea sp.]
EILHGAPKLTRYLNKDFRTWFRNKARIIQAWIDQGKMDPVDPYHLIFLIWSSTQHYADFNAQVCAVLGKSHLSRRDYQKIADSLTTIILKGCGIALPGEQS